MTGLGPSLRRLPSVDARTAGTSTTASQAEGTSDAGDSADGNASGRLFALSQPGWLCFVGSHAGTLYECHNVDT